MTTGKVFMSGNSQAVRLPKEFRVDADEVELSRDGEKIVMTPKTKPYGQRLIEALDELSDLIELPPDLPQQHRDGL
ncbi:antitoxin [Enterovirga rhinocerotis]|uniref:Antitoxin VapB n=1 Tax=Enterovirga rhinocerotis TaxID=1339210 RepID=A0A4R7BMP4_9HYPH|nr:AbrB/MazE/SpoVT family DNA-binding domain-containing protein [Enterovirga rhinocerotis]TDR85197.1 antitoxin VapB [Enterovirga rhinocerotis]